MSGITLARPLQLQNKPVTRVENYCATGSEALRQAAYAVASGVRRVTTGASLTVQLPDSGVNVGEIIEVDAPGLSSSNLERFDFKRIRRPIFPLDPDTTYR